ncbi:MAG: cytochrome c oxidase subunit II [Terriglobia bacterium]
METSAASKSKGAGGGRLLALVTWLIPVVVVALGLKRWLPPLASEHGGGVDLMINYLLVTVGGLFVVGHLVLGYFIWRYSRAGQVTFRLPSRKVERRWSLIPVVLMTLIAEGGVFVLGLPVWGKLYADAPPAEAVPVEITAEQFAWNIRYPGPDGAFGRTSPQLISLDNPVGLDERDPAARDDVVILNELNLPVNRAVRIRLRSKDTLHSFFLPHLRIKQDMVPGMTIEIWFVPTETGTYEIACAELCGFGHFQMRGLLQVMSPERFEQWLKEEPTFF